MSHAFANAHIEAFSREWNRHFPFTRCSNKAASNDSALVPNRNIEIVTVVQGN
jgi:hypothetical protein